MKEYKKIRVEVENEKLQMVLLITFTLRIIILGEV